jgi:hypothetical protein
MTGCMGKDAVDGGKQAAVAVPRLRAPSRFCAPDSYLLTFLTLLTLCNLSKSPRSCERDAVYCGSAWREGQPEPVEISA